MNEIQLYDQYDINGGGVATWVACIVIGTALYKVVFSKGGRVSIPRLISIEWR